MHRITWYWQCRYIVTSTVIKIKLYQHVAALWIFKGKVKSSGGHRVDLVFTLENVVYLLIQNKWNIKFKFEISMQHCMATRYSLLSIRPRDVKSAQYAIRFHYALRLHSIIIWQCLRTSDLRVLNLKYCYFTKILSL